MEQVMNERPGRGVWDFAVDHRIRISAGLFLGLLLVNLALGNVPARVIEISDPVGALAAVLIVGGLGLRSWAAGTLRKGKALTTWGPYRLCRHPLYLGSLLVMTGFCLLVPNLLNAVVVLGPICLIYALTVRREERRLARKYGAAWADYAATTPRLLPLGFSAGLAGAWSFAQWSRSREHRAAITVLVAFVALELWHTFLGPFVTW